MDHKSKELRNWMTMFESEQEGQTNSFSDDVDYEDDVEGIFTDVAQKLKATVVVEVEKVAGSASAYEGDIRMTFTNGKDLDYTYKESMNPEIEGEHVIAVDGDEVYNSSEIPDDDDYKDIFDNYIV